MNSLACHVPVLRNTSDTLASIPHEIGAFILVIGKIMFDTNAVENPALILGAIVTIIGAALKLVMYALHTA